MVDRARIQGTSVDRDSWQQVRELFDAVCDLPCTQWSTELARLSANPSVIAETLQNSIVLVGDCTDEDLLRPPSFDARGIAGL